MSNLLLQMFNRFLFTYKILIKADNFRHLQNENHNSKMIGRCFASVGDCNPSEDFKSFQNWHIFITLTCCWVWPVSSETRFLNWTFASTVSVSSLYAYTQFTDLSWQFIWLSHLTQRCNWKGHGVKMGKTHFDVLSLFSCNWLTRLLVCSCSVCSKLFNSCNSRRSQVNSHSTRAQKKTER